MIGLQPATRFGVSRPRLSVVAAAKGFGAPKPKQAAVGQTCACGSKLVYKECCEPLHTGRVLPTNGETALRSRFSAFSKGELDYLLATDQRTALPEDQRKRESQYACNALTYSGLKVLQLEAVEGDAQWIKFQYQFKQQPRGRRPSNNKSVNLKAEEPERLLDGSIKVFTTVERSKFQRCDSGAWVLVESETISKE